ncbi:unnamed protein product [Caenorhabditis auriculariae]|uniref:Peptidase M12B domain-containing protein n=1 Tax=Caenorhabditis auriculariae TaxID=2777116 RepID=A0A8S1GP36_9PELO|nr:unnamed protein product [Caenorhabditis auriculariae]
MFVLIMTACAAALFQGAVAIHREMSPTELRHFFGTSDKGKVPEYFLDKPVRTDADDGTFYYNVTFSDRSVQYFLRRRHDLFAKEFHVVLRDESPSISLHLPVADCVYEGESVSHDGMRIALAGCGNNLHGMVITPEGEYHLIQPHARSGHHVIHKRSLDEMEHSCLFEPENDPYPEDRAESAMKSTLMRLVKDIRRSDYRKDILTVELAVFTDDAMWQHFRRMYGTEAEENMHTFIMAVVNNIDILYTQKTIQPRINIKNSSAMSARQHLSGNVDKLLDAFCQYQHDINPPHESDPRHWDHALLFSGYDLYRDGMRTVAGYAPVKGMCSGVRSCTINEGLDFGSVFVVTHEMGHSLGMYHDGDNDCDLRCCIMSPSVGTGKTHWSHCSVSEMSTFVGHLGDDFRAPNCLRDSPTSEQPAMMFKDKENPGQLFTLDEQCEIFHGECWKHELKDGQKLQNVCSMVWCGNGEGIIRTAHPALEGTYCGFGMVCHQGQCVGTNKYMRVASGGWSAWNDRPSSSCGGTCTPCEIRGQIRVIRSIRQCNNPSPNNGGAPCYGDEARGIRCGKEVCNGDSIENFATRTCSKLRDENAIPNTQLSGQGIQFEQALCKIWCLIAGSNNIRTVSNFPDGTPCGGNRYCIKGECRPLLCSGTTITSYESQCAQSTKMLPTPAQPKKTNSYKEQKKIPFLNEWSGWSAWSDCISYDCRTAGLKVRVRRCLAGTCIGSSKERMPCYRPCTETETATTTIAPQQSFGNRFIAPFPNGGGRPVTVKKVPGPMKTGDWGLWSGCSTSCGPGQKIRRRNNCVRDCTEVAVCSVAECSEGWTEWSDFSQCSKSCGGGLQTRKRACYVSFCRGKDSEVKRCMEQDCAHRTHFERNGSWTAWSAWSSCTTRCGYGSRTRRRRCYQGVCKGTEEERESCRGTECKT